MLVVLGCVRMGLAEEGAARKQRREKTLFMLMVMSSSCQSIFVDGCCGQEMAAARVGGVVFDAASRFFKVPSLRLSQARSESWRMASARESRPAGGGRANVGQAGSSCRRACSVPFQCCTVSIAISYVSLPYTPASPSLAQPRPRHLFHHPHLLLSLLVLFSSRCQVQTLEC